MSSTNTAKYSDIRRKGSDFTFTGKLADYSRNDDWVESYKDSIGEDSTSNKFSSMWKTIRTGTEDAGNEIYRKILNYVDDIGNIDTCGIDKLKEYGKILGSDSELLNTNITFPIEIKNLIDILSVNRAYLYNKATDGSDDTLVLSNTILHSSTVKEFLDSLEDVGRFKNLIHNCIYNTLIEFINLKNVTFDDSANGIDTREIWKIDISRFTNKLWSDDVESDDEVYKLKMSLNISKSFTEKVYADDIISGKRSIEDFSDSEKIVIRKEMESRQKRYGDANSMRYYYVRMYKVLEYFRFCATVYNSIYELTQYDLDETKYSVVSNSDSSSIVVYNYDSYELNTSLIRKVTEWITDFILSVSKLRSDMKSQCQRNTMSGTKRLLIDMIRKFIIDNIDTDVWDTMKSNILKNSGLNRNFDVDIVQYVDTTDYTNIENDNDSVTPSEHTLRPRFWNDYNGLNNSISNDEVLKFFNRLEDDGRKFKSNRYKSSFDDTNLYEFLSVLFEMGATSNVNSDFYLSSDVYTTVDGNEVTSESVETLSDDAKNVILKFSGDENIGSAPYANDKNTLHPSYQVMPFIQAFEEYNEAYSSVVNLVSSYTENVKESVSRLSKRLDSLGNTINFWYQWNDDFSGYTTTREKARNNTGSSAFADSPYNFYALNELKEFKEDYINSLLSGKNEYYIDSNTGKCILDDSEVSTEIARIQKYYDKIIQNADREIYKYGKDYNGNIYILYKEKGHRNDRSALGDIWIRLKGHPIAFPLFDVTSSPTGFNTTSCLSETDNSKLLSVLEKIISYFESKYEKGSVIPINIGISYGTYDNTLPIVSETKGVSSIPSFDFNYEDFDVDSNPKMVLVNSTNSNFNNIVDELKNGVIYDVSDTPLYEQYGKTSYYVDSITNDILASGSDTTIKVYSEDESGKLTEVQNKTGKIVSIADENYFTCEHDSYTNTLSLCVDSTRNNELIFMEYSDENQYDDGITYYCRETSVDASEMHPCSKRTITLKRIFKMSPDALSGSVEEGGNVRFGKKGDFYENSTYFTTESASSVVDGSMVYENFNAYEYRVSDGESTKTVDKSSIILLGGCNPYYPYYDDNGNLKLREATFVDTQTTEYDAYDFGDNIYRTYVRSEYVSSYPVSDCKFSTTYEDTYSDSFGQFTLRSNPYKKLYPYTSIYGHPFEDPSGGYENLPKGHVVVRDKDGNDHTFYYNLSSWDKNGTEQHILVKCLKYNRHFSTMNVTSVKFNGKIELIPSNSSEYPIYLNFNDSGVDNLATYTSNSVHQDQRKFFDMGFSYNQKMFYMTYYNDSESFTDSGTLLGSFVESHDENYNEKLSFFRDSSKNLEYVDPSFMYISDNSSVSKAFHIGDCSTKRGIISAYARKYNPKNDTSSDDNPCIEINLTFISERNVYEHKFNIPLRYDLYEFTGDDALKKGIYSIKLSCTLDRAYVSMVTETPEDGDIVCNTIDGSSIGKGGSTEFYKIKDKCGDSTITILSFDITDISNFIYKEDETRYILESGKIGYFSQFSGIDGKNNIFSNEKLSADTEFSFELKTDAISSESTGIKFYSELKSDITIGSSDEISEPIGRFINIYPNNLNSSESFELTGIAVSEGNGYAYAVIASEDGGRGVKFSNFDGKKIYDMSRGIGNGVMFFSDGDDTDTRVGAFYENTDAEGFVDTNGLKKVKIPVQTSLSGYYSTNFTELEDTEENVYAFCSDGKTIVRTAICDRGDSFIPTSGIAVVEYTSRGTVSTYAELTSLKYAENGYVYTLAEAYGGHEENSLYEKTDNGWEYREPREIGETEILMGTGVEKSLYSDEYENNSHNGGRAAFSLKRDGIYTIFGAYGNKAISIKPQIGSGNGFVYNPIVFFIGKTPYVIEYSNTVETNGIKTAVYNVLQVGEDANMTQVYTEDSEGNAVAHSLMFDFSDQIKGFVDTYVDGIKMIYTERGGIYRYTFKDNEPTLSYTFDDLKEQLPIEEYDMEVTMHECETHLLIGYYIDELETGGVLQIRKNIPDSKASAVDITDVNGGSISNFHVGKILSIKDIVLMSDSNSGLVYKSTDGGLHFSVLEESVLYKMELVGCGTNKFYARYGNNEKAYSYYGDTWINAIGIPFSNWRIFNANGFDYIACETYDSDLEASVVDTKKYVMIDAQHSFDEEYDGFKLKGDTIVCYGGTDGSSPIKISRSGSITGDFEYFEFKYSKNIAYNRVERIDNDLIMPPDGGNFALAVRDAFNLDKTPSIEYIDVSSHLNGNVNSFGGFETVHGRLLMIPKYGDRILAYNENNCTFYNFLSFGSVMEFSDIDSIDGDDESDALITPKYLGSDGSLTIYKTDFSNKDYYGIVEIDKGFPIMVTYGKYKTEFKYGGTSYDIYSITFTFMNDVNNKSVTILSQPELEDGEPVEAQDIINEEKSKSALYVSGESSVCYNFSTEGNEPLYKIKKIFKKTGETIDESDFLTVTYSLQSAADRNAISMDYDMSGDSIGGVSVYKNFNNPQYNIQLRDIDITDSSSFVVLIPDEVIEKSENVDIRVRITFAESANASACTIYWGDGEFNETIIGSSEDEEIRGNYIVKDGNEHTYSHSYYSGGEFTISIGGGASHFACGTLGSNSDKTTEYVHENLCFSNSEYLTSAEKSFMGCSNMVGGIPDWGTHITVAASAYMGCSKLDSSEIPNWNTSMTDISDCYNGCSTIGETA